MASITDRMSFTGRTVLVTGGSKGIGRATVEGFAALGATVWYTYRAADASVAEFNAHTRAAGYAVVGLACDVTDAAAVAALRERFAATCNTLDVLVNNVGDAVRRSSFAESDDALWATAFDVNTLSAVRITRVFLPFLRASGGAAIVNVSSIAASTGGSGDSLHYAVAKAGVSAFTIGLAKEVGRDGIRVVGVAPSVIDTDFQRRHSSDERTQRILAQTPLGRVGTAQEVADVIIFLASDAARYVTGTTVAVTGGR